MTVFVLLLELVGTAAFAVSGAMLGMKKNMDVFGVCVMGVTTACGGGVLRDLLLGALPPVMFQKPVYALTAIVVSVLIFLPWVRRGLIRREHVYETVMRFADAAGLGVFTAVGVAAAFHQGYGDSTFFAVFLGVITGVGGGVMRDMMAGSAPYIFVKHIYACASIAGALLCALLWRAAGETAAMLICCASVLLIRLLAAHYHWSLPKARLDETEKL
ncbi:MAG: TRIC cation channel family protein [Oscillospiraceae bacterium]|nr:TRIC cation channel family protein [Oscillospiraceae bacterium]